MTSKRSPCGRVRPKPLLSISYRLTPATLICALMRRPKYRASLPGRTSQKSGVSAGDGGPEAGGGLGAAAGGAGALFAARRGFAEQRSERRRRGRAQRGAAACCAAALAAPVQEQALRVSGDRLLRACTDSMAAQDEVV